MKRIIYFALAVFGMSLLLESCGGDDWMQGYWVNEDSSQYLYVNGDEVYLASPQSKKSINCYTVNTLFKEQEKPMSFKLGKTLIYDDIDDSYSFSDIKIKSLNEDALYEEFPYIDESYSWTCAINNLFEEENLKNIKLIGIELRGEVDANLLFSDNKAKRLLFLGKKDYNSLYNLSSFTKFPQKSESECRIHANLERDGFDLQGDYTEEEFKKIIIAINNGGDDTITKYEFDDLPESLREKMIAIGDISLFPELRTLSSNTGGTNKSKKSSSLTSSQVEGSWYRYTTLSFASS